MVRKISEKLNTKYIGRNIYYKEETESTNIDAKENVCCETGSVFISSMQTKGRGRQGRYWESKKNEGIFMSILLKPDISPDKLSAITLLASLSICSVLEKYLNDTKIKWPNDIIINNRKISGILSEVVFDNDKANVIIGIGVNVNNKAFVDDLAFKATSLFIETKNEFKIENIIAEILNKFEREYERFLNDGISPFIEEYKKKCITINKNVRIIHPSGDFDAIAIDVTDKGELVVKKDDENIILNSCEISVRGVMRYVDS